LICAIGKAHFFNKNFFDPQKKTTIIDVGMNILNGKITGDVNQDDIKEVAGAITPVPGGVGPMTVITLIQNLIYATEQKFKGLT
jgi:methylenetetrahydrofolate dehydrogenase (NADP+) / methenyltetrahydrofolate cyclohydrolase